VLDIRKTKDIMCIIIMSDVLLNLGNFFYNQSFSTLCCTNRLYP